ncbi:uncharacterized protein KIAA1211 homolog [Papaver somniferum]|uniref:uncharacterized protein KIAA1211 homolog n=1 Tax=Papaver somniferum TaxID=3469 RepID=UPI000E6FF859|nr:uncharacterized protein KIAA1211 homolog [Papaver somniferum]
MIGQMTKDDLDKVHKRVNDLLYDIEVQPLWEEMHAATDEIKAEEKPVQKPVQILQKKRHLDLFIDEEQEEKFWEVQSKKMRLAEMAIMKKENDNDRFGTNDALLAQKTDSETNDADENEEEEWFDEEQDGSGEEERGLMMRKREQEIPNKRMQEEQNRRQEEFDRQRIANEEEYQFWIRKYEARCARKRRERQEMIERLERYRIKTRSTTESESDEEGGEEVEFDEDDSSSVSTDPEIEARERRRHERDDAEMYLLYLAEKAQPRIFARTMSEPLNVDSDGEEIPGMDVNGNPIAAEVQEEENEGSEDDEDGGYGPAASTSTNSGVDFSCEEEGFNTDDDQW